MKKQNSPVKSLIRMIVLAFLFLCAIQIKAQTPSMKVFEEWRDTAGTQNTFYKACTKTIPGTSNVLVAGATLNSSGNYDMLVEKMNGSGVVLWAQQYDGTGHGDDIAADVLVDGSGNIYITGTEFENNTTNFNDAITIKYNSSGTLQWVSTYTGNGGFEDGTVALCFDNTASYLFAVGSEWEGITNKYDMLVLRIKAADGSQSWVTTFDDATLNDLAYRVAYDISSATVYVGGGSEVTAGKYDYSVLNIKAGSGSINSNYTTSISGSGIDNLTGLQLDGHGNAYVTGGVFNGTSYDFLTQKLDTALSVLWSAQWDDPDGLDDVATGISLDNGGNVIVTGSARTPSNENDYVTIKYDSTGAQIWVSTFNDVSNGDDRATAIVVKDTNQIYVTGRSFNGSNDDYYTIKYDKSGTEVWHIGFNSVRDGNDIATGIALDTLGNIIVTGQNKAADSTFAYTTVKYVEKPIITPTSSDSIGAAFYFRANMGQVFNTGDSAQPDIRFYNYHDGSSEQLYFTNTKMSYVWEKQDTASSSPMDTLVRVDMNYLSAKSTRKIYSTKERGDYSNYILSKLAPYYIARVKHYDELVYSGIYNSTDVIYSSNAAGLKYYYVIKPGGTPTSIKEQYSGAQSVSVSSGKLIVSTYLGNLVYARPNVWQIDGSGIVHTLAWQPTWSVTDSTASFSSIGTYNTAYTLVIEITKGYAPSPTSQNPNDNLEWATHYAGTANGNTAFQCVKAGLNGDIVISGQTTSTYYPTTVNTNPFQIFAGGGTDGIFLKFDTTAQRLWVTYLGGSATEVHFKHDIDTASDILFCAKTDGQSPMTNLSGGYFDSTLSGTSDWYLGKLSKSGSSLLWGTLYGGNSDEEPFEIKMMNKNNRVYVVGKTFSTNFPNVHKSGAYNNNTGNVAIAEFNIALDTVWSCQFGDVNSYASSVDGDSTDAIVISGGANASSSANFPLLNPGGSAYYSSNVSRSFILKLDRKDTVKWCTGFGGEFCYGTLRTTNGQTYIVGRTYNITGFPFVHQTGDYFQNATPSVYPDAYIARFNNNDSLIWSTLYGASGDDYFWNVCEDYNHTVYVSGQTQSTGFSTQANGTAYVQAESGFADDFVLSFSPMNHVVWSTCFGGTGSEPFFYYSGLDTYQNSKVYIAGGSSSTHLTFPWDYPPGGYIDTLKTTTGNPSGYIARFGVAGLVLGTENNTGQVQENGMLIYPNPTNGSLTVKVDNINGENVEITVYDMLGQVVLNRKREKVLGTLLETLDMGGNTCGIYFVSVKIGSSRTLSKKVIRE